MSSPISLSASNSSSSCSCSMSTKFIDAKTGEEYEFLGTSIQFSEKELIALETDHDQQIDCFVQHLIETGYFDEDWSDDQEVEEEQEEEEEEELHDDDKKVIHVKSPRPFAMHISFKGGFVECINAVN